MDDPAFSPDWQRCYAAFLLHCSSGSLHTSRGYASALRPFFAFLDGRSPSMVTREDVERFLSTPLVRNPVHLPSARTRNLRLYVIKSFYSFASCYLVDQEPLFAGPSPTLGIKPARVHLLFRGLSLSELSRFFAVIPTNTVRGLRDRALFLTYFWTARRRSEIARLTWGDLTYGSIMTAEGDTYEGWLYSFTGKGKHGQPDLAELPQPAKDAIDAYLRASGRLSTMAPDDPLFQALPPARGGGLPLNPKRSMSGQAIWARLKLYCAAAGLDTRRITVHSFRHTAAQLRHQYGESLRSLQRLLRHERIETTNAYLEAATSAADPGAHKLMEDPRFQFSVGGQ